jgi:hypothetical protein
LFVSASVVEKKKPPSAPGFWVEVLAALHENPRRCECRVGIRHAARPQGIQNIPRHGQIDVSTALAREACAARIE